jgi:deoxyribodipyrimidine photolyase-related protein
MNDQFNCLLIYPNQLSIKILDGLNKEATKLLIVESRVRQCSLPFHKKKLVFEISASRHFANRLKSDGWTVEYVVGEATECEVVKRLVEQSPHVMVMAFRPDDWLLHVDITKLTETFPHRVEVLDNPLHMVDTSIYVDKVKSGTHRMEYFYRDMRRMTGILMEAGKPVGGEWNYDKDNRKPLPKSLPLPNVLQCEPDTLTMEVIEYVNEHFAGHMGSTDGFAMAVTEDDALMLADDFFAHRLAQFGPYEDAMKYGQDIIFHSGLSAYINLGLLDPLDLCRRAEHEFQCGRVSLPSAEGFIRQIIGWREYVRVYYDAMMPDVVHANALGHNKALPDMYWSGNAQGMRCMEGCLKPVLEQGYIHHIPRLMVLSNFANLTQTDPAQLYLWFWYAFVDAHDWVVLPNVLGMSTYSDGGVLASKPYISGGNYINKMSDYCKGCRYDPGRRTGEDACPFTFLYWNYVDTNRDILTQNARLSFPVSTFDKMADVEQDQIRVMSEQFIRNLTRYRKTLSIEHSTLKNED